MGSHDPLLGTFPRHKQSSTQSGFEIACLGLSFSKTDAWTLGFNHHIEVSERSERCLTGISNWLTASGLNASHVLYDRAKRHV